MWPFRFDSSYLFLNLDFIAEFNMIKQLKVRNKSPCRPLVVSFPLDLVSLLASPQAAACFMMAAFYFSPAVSRRTLRIIVMSSFLPGSSCSELPRCS